jgi:hypothetical protein
MTLSGEPAACAPYGAPSMSSSLTSFFLLTQASLIAGDPPAPGRSGRAGMSVPRVTVALNIRTGNPRGTPLRGNPVRGAFGMTDTLTLPIPASVTASYLVPASMSAETARARVMTALDARAPGGMPPLVRSMIGTPAVTIRAQRAAAWLPLTLSDRGYVDATPGQLAAIGNARGFVAFTVRCPTEITPVHEWTGRTLAAVLAAELGVPVLDVFAPCVLSADAAMESLRVKDNRSVRFSDWVEVFGSAPDGRMWLATRGLYRYGLPELRVRHVPPEMGRTWRSVLTGLALRVHQEFAGAVRGATPPWQPAARAPAFVEIPAEIYVGENAVASAYGAEHADAFAGPVGLDFDRGEAPRSASYLTVRPPVGWYRSADDYFRSACAVLAWTR